MTSAGTTFRGFFAAYMSRWFIKRWSAGFVYAPNAPVPLATRSWCIRCASASQYTLSYYKRLSHIQTLIYLTSVERSGPTNPVNKRRQPRVVSIGIVHCTPFAPAHYSGYRPLLFLIFHFQPHKWPSAVTMAGITIPLRVPGAKSDSVVDLIPRTACAQGIVLDRQDGFFKYWRYRIRVSFITPELPGHSPASNGARFARNGELGVGKTYGSHELRECDFSLESD